MIRITMTTKKNICDEEEILVKVHRDGHWQYCHFFDPGEIKIVKQILDTPQIALMYLTVLNYDMCVVASAVLDKLIDDRVDGHSDPKKIV